MRVGRVGRVGLALLGTLVAVAVTAPLLAPYGPRARVGIPFGRPGGGHVLGTNDVGADLLSELLYGARVSLAVGLAAAVAATAIGTTVGLVAGYARGLLDTILMRVVDVVLSLPFLPLAIVVGVFVGPGIPTLIGLIAAVNWAGTARELRSQVLSARELDHVDAARSMGAGTFHVLGRHVLTEVTPLVVPQFVQAAKVAILAEASLSFLGLGDPSTPSWGATLSAAHARNAFLTDAWLWWVVPPGLAIGLTVLAFALVGYGFEEAARPRLRTRPVKTPPVPKSPPIATAGSDPAAAGRPVLAVSGLTVRYDGPGGGIVAVDDVSITVGAGELVGLIGESGSGKTTLVAAATGLLRPPAAVTAGRVVLEGDDLAGLSPSELRRRRSTRVALVPQQAMASLDPVLRVGDQLAEAVRAHQSVSRAQARARAAELLGMVGIDPDRARHHPHQLSGGMRQRVVIAMAVANDPDLLIADEPTTALDVTIQAQVLDV
ncbi:MAG TPA: dipeptide/oligopeptide/nickel ABC transporter permease/ATP-binding protein, partial [Acidimicrobiales bacterium]|nr:dipeptide/oligopeptide/nickel ABC transporter permease/ATP-binding protein [Acidimicrobiales bacterium]